MVEYNFYKDKYHGVSITAEEWPAAEREASATLARYKRIYTVTAPTEDAESMAICAMADVLLFNAKMESGQMGIVSSASIGSVSVSYSNSSGATSASSTDLSAKAKERRVYHACSMYLDIYRGVGGC